MSSSSVSSSDTAQSLSLDSSPEKVRGDDSDSNNMSDNRMGDSTEKQSCRIADSSEDTGKIGRGMPHELSLSGPSFAIYHHAACQKHNIRQHIEQPARTEAILAELRKRWKADYFREADRVTPEQILRFHSEEYWDRLCSYFDFAERKNAVHNIDGDTQVMQFTREAALRAAGGIVNAIDHLFLLPSSSLKIV